MTRSARPWPASPATRRATSTSWLGQHQRPVETERGIQTIQMGRPPARVGVGRFLSVGPVEGGSDNNYEYAAGDPLNNFDLDGLGVCSASGRGASSVGDPLQSPPWDGQRFGPSRLLLALRLATWCLMPALVLLLRLPKQAALGRHSRPAVPYSRASVAR